MVEKMQRPKLHVSEKQRSGATAVRRETTAAGRIIRAGVRPHRFRRASFRRQTLTGPHVVDFVGRAAKSMMEVDGGQHFEPENIRRGARQDGYRRAQGYGAARFDNIEVMTDSFGVLKAIAAAPAGPQAPSLTFSRRRGRGPGYAGREDAP